MQLWSLHVAVLSEAGPKFPLLLGLWTLQCRPKIPDLHCSPVPYRTGQEWWFRRWGNLLWPCTQGGRDCSIFPQSIQFSHWLGLCPMPSQKIEGLQVTAGCSPQTSSRCSSWSLEQTPLAGAANNRSASSLRRRGPSLPGRQNLPDSLCPMLHGLFFLSLILSWGALCGVETPHSQAEEAFQLQYPSGLSVATPAREGHSLSMSLLLLPFSLRLLQCSWDIIFQISYTSSFSSWLLCTVLGAVARSLQLSCSHLVSLKLLFNVLQIL